MVLFQKPFRVDNAKCLEINDNSTNIDREDPRDPPNVFFPGLPDVTDVFPGLVGVNVFNSAISIGGTQQPSTTVPTAGLGTLIIDKNDYTTAQWLEVPYGTLHINSGGGTLPDAATILVKLLGSDRSV